ncbi:FtsX-like permease family protein [Aurantibacillus circumpalustris]|uniref:FtsX-like permease family protein n=1 Tax=Aurantibacillus circumpalustris TaxID=3036359 RepID=UPI00295A9A5D|nr:FtsX-like permease family protein [Aurantibacillus circumpalustris]
MSVSLYIAKRYLVSKKSNNAINIISWISIIAIAVTTGALIVILSAMNGLTNTVANLYNTFEPDIKITSAEGKYFDAPKKFIDEIKSIQGVKIISQSLSDKVLAKNVDKQALLSIKGVDMNFNKITAIDSAVVEGVYGLNDSGSRKILLGRGVANQLSVNFNVFVNELSLFSPLKGKSSSLNPEDNLNQIYCTPSGIFSLNDELDYQYAFVSLKTARELFDLPEKVSALEISCEQGEAENVQEILKEKLGDSFVIKNRYQLNDVLFKSLETEKLATFIILAFILVIATFNIIGALTMLIIEKRKDIKTLHSLGANLGLIRGIFMREAFLISGIGATLGLLLGITVCWLQIQFHLVKFGSEFIVPYYPIEMQFKDFVWIFGLIMIIGFFAALYPVRIFTKTDLVH